MIAGSLPIHPSSLVTANGRAFDNDGHMVEMTEFTAGCRIYSPNSDRGFRIPPKKPKMDTKSSGDDATTSDGGSIDVNFSDLELPFESSSDPFRPFGLQRPTTIGPYIDRTSDFARNRRSWTTDKSPTGRDSDEEEVATPVIAPWRLSDDMHSHGNQKASDVNNRSDDVATLGGLIPSATRKSIIKNENSAESDEIELHAATPDANKTRDLQQYRHLHDFDQGVDIISRTSVSAEQVNSGMDDTWKTEHLDGSIRGQGSLNVRLQPVNAPLSTEQHNASDAPGSVAQPGVQSEDKNHEKAVSVFEFLPSSSAPKPFVGDSEKNASSGDYPYKAEFEKYTFTVPPAKPPGDQRLTSPRHYSSDSDVSARLPKTQITSSCPKSTSGSSTLHEPLALDMRKVNSDPDSTVGTFSYNHRRSVIPHKMQPQSPMSTSISNPDLFQFSPSSQPSLTAPAAISNPDPAISLPPSKTVVKTSPSNPQPYMENTRSRICTAKATSTALARRDKSEDRLDDVVSAVASVEAQGENPFIAIARASARAATVATASAAQTVATADSTEDNEEDIAVVISTSCVIKNRQDSSVLQDTQGVLQSVGHGVSVSVQTKPHAAIIDAATQSSPNMRRRLKIVLEQPDSRENQELRTLECDLPEAAQQQEIQSIVNTAVKKMFERDAKSYTQEEIERTLISTVTEQVVHAYSNENDDVTGSGSQRPSNAEINIPCSTSSKLPPWHSVKSDFSPSTRIIKSTQRTPTTSPNRATSTGYFYVGAKESEISTGETSMGSAINQGSDSTGMNSVLSPQLPATPISKSMTDGGNYQPARTELVFMPSHNQSLSPKRLPDDSDQSLKKTKSHKSKATKKKKKKSQHDADSQVTVFQAPLDVGSHTPTSSYKNTIACATMEPIDVGDNKQRKLKKSQASLSQTIPQDIGPHIPERQFKIATPHVPLQIIDLDEYKPKKVKQTSTPATSMKPLSQPQALRPMYDPQLSSDVDSAEDLQRFNASLVTSNVHAPMNPIDISDHRPKKKKTKDESLPRVGLQSIELGPYTSGEQYTRLKKEMTSDDSSSEIDFVDTQGDSVSIRKPDRGKTPGRPTQLGGGSSNTSLKEHVDSPDAQVHQTQPMPELNSAERKTRIVSAKGDLHAPTMPVDTTDHKPRKTKQINHPEASLNTVHFAPYSSGAQHAKYLDSSTPDTQTEKVQYLHSSSSESDTEEDVPTTVEMRNKRVHLPMPEVKKHDTRKHKAKTSSANGNVIGETEALDINDHKPNFRKQNESPGVSMIPMHIGPTATAGGFDKKSAIIHNVINFSPKPVSSSDATLTEDDSETKKKEGKKKKKKRVSEGPSKKKGILKKPIAYEGDDEADPDAIKLRSGVTPNYPPSNRLSLPSQIKRSFGMKATERTVPKKKEYKSVLQEPYQDGRTPLHILEQFNVDAPKSQLESRCKVNNLRQKFYQQTAIHNQDETRNDRPKSGPPQVKPFLVNVNLDNTHQRSQSKKSNPDEVKKKLDSVRLKAPPSYVDKVWNAGELIASRSQDRGLDKAGRYSLRDYSFQGVSSDVNFQRSKSLTSVEINQFFNDRGPYLPLGDSQNHLDAAFDRSPVLSSDDSKAKSMNDLLSADMETTDGFSSDGLDKHQSMVTLPTQAKQAPQNIPFQNSNIEDKSKSESELRISRSLNKLSLPMWYTESKRQSQEIVMLPNTKSNKLTNSHRPKMSSIDPQLPKEGDGRPVVIQHWVSPPMRMSSPMNSKPSSPMVEGQPELYHLPSSNLKEKSKAYKPIRMKDFEEISVKLPEQKQPVKPAREAYIRLREQSRSREDLDVKDPEAPSTKSNQHKPTTLDAPSTEELPKVKKKKSSKTEREKKIKKKKKATSSSEPINISNGSLSLTPDTFTAETEVAKEGELVKKKKKKKKKTTESAKIEEDGGEKKKKKKKSKKEPEVLALVNHVQLEGPLRTSSPQLPPAENSQPTMQRTDNQSDSARGSPLVDSGSGSPNSTVAHHGNKTQQLQQRRSDLHDSGFSEQQTPTGAPFPTQSPIYPRYYSGVDDPIYVNIPRFSKSTYAGVAERRSLQLTEEEKEQNSTASKPRPSSQPRHHHRM